MRIRYLMKTVKVRSGRPLEDPGLHQVCKGTKGKAGGTLGCPHSYLKGMVRSLASARMRASCLPSSGVLILNWTWC